MGSGPCQTLGMLWVLASYDVSIWSFPTEDCHCRDAVPESVLPGFQNSYPVIEPREPWIPNCLWALVYPPTHNMSGVGRFPESLVVEPKREGEEGVRDGEEEKRKKNEATSGLAPLGSQAGVLFAFREGF